MVRRIGNQSRRASHRIRSVIKKAAASGQRTVHHMASALSHLLPDSAFARSHRRKTFQTVYRKSQFFSGVGSHGVPAAAYVDAMVPIVLTHLNAFGGQATILDLGCGDFSVGYRLLQGLPPIIWVAMSYRKLSNTTARNMGAVACGSRYSISFVKIFRMATSALCVRCSSIFRTVTLRRCCQNCGNLDMCT